MTPSTGTFYELGIAPKILERLDKIKYTTPTPIQQKSIPPAIAGEDIVGIAQTGTGKTLSFAIPILQRLAQVQGRALVILPTRELALQVNEEFFKVGQTMNMRTAVLIGGEPIRRQIQDLAKDPRIIIATPGRLIDHMQQHHIHLGDVTILVLDEADRMLDMGFAPQIATIMACVAPVEYRQTMLFSATMPKEIIEIATKQMKLPTHIEVAPPGTTSERITQELFVVKKEMKNLLLQKILEQYKGSVLIFSRTKFGARKISRALRQLGHRAAEIHSDRSLNERKEALEGFKRGKYRILVATDIASRGIDVTGIELVINYDLPDDADNYVHRIGRTGRAGHQGHAISFATPDQKDDVRSIEVLVKAAIPVSDHPNVPKEEYSRSSSPRPSYKPRSFGGGNRGGSGGGGGFKPRRPSSSHGGGSFRPKR
ncbi:MAG: DEAD/DEAH box helicase [Candidatus Omnitrophica bacterium]|nr:DEAD/DEAH box helicase [Candidatus Omnitrophota bacterium]